MPYRLEILGIVATLAGAALVSDSGWELRPATGDHGAVLSVDAGETVTYRFECAPNDVIVTETGVTELIDLRTGNAIGDDAAAVMPAGAAMMALFGGKGDPKFMPAEAVKNPAGGWDLTIRLPKGDKQLKAIGKSEVIALFTTGITIAGEM